MTSVTEQAQAQAGDAILMARPLSRGKDFLPFILALLAILAIYFSTLRTMAHQWWNYETYTHGMLVPLFSVWLIWRRRSEWLHLPLRPNLGLLSLLLLASLVWLLGELAIVFPVTEFALVGMMVLAVPVLLGWPMARINAFPLLFVFFAVPVGEALLPLLMTWTADFTVFALRLTGIPVYREGQQFVIPSGNWSVVEACSGIRYLIASAMVGTLYAYLTYRSFVRRAVFCLVAILVPLVANWVRAYMIVMIGHLSDNRLATGVDHLIYGWIFFGLVMMIMFWIGAWWREDTHYHVPVMPTEVMGDSGPLSHRWRAAILVLLVAGLGKITFQAIDDPADATSKPALAMPAAIGEWHAVADDLTYWRPRYVSPSNSVWQIYAKGQTKIGVFIAYYRGQTSERKLISSANILVASSDNEWTRVATNRVPVRLAGDDLNVLSTELLDRNRTRLNVWSWYWVNGQYLTNDYKAKMATAWSRLTGHGDDSAVVMVFANRATTQAEVDALLRDFAGESASAIGQVLARSSSQR